MSSSLMGSAIKALAANAPFFPLRKRVEIVALQPRRREAPNFHFGQQ